MWHVTQQLWWYTVYSNVNKQAALINGAVASFTTRCLRCSLSVARSDHHHHCGEAFVGRALHELTLIRVGTVSLWLGHFRRIQIRRRSYVPMLSLQ